MRKAKANPAQLVTGVDWSQTYAVCVTDTAASPRYNPGDTVHVHPDLPVEPDNWVLIVRRAPSSKASPVSVMARLIARDSKVVIVQQLNPAGIYTLDAASILSIHRIVGSSEAGT